MLLRRVVDHFLVITDHKMYRSKANAIWYSGHAIEAKTLINKTMYK